LIASFSSAVLSGVLIGCAHPRLAAAGYNVSSERSDYSPTVRLAVALPLAPLGKSGDTVTVVIDSAVITAPGARAADTLPVMRNLYITALLATNAPERDKRGPPAAPWLAVAVGDSALLTEALRLGEYQRLRGFQLHIPFPNALDRARTWLIFRVTGVAVTREIELADGRLIAAKQVAGGVRVFACADWTLAGYVDRVRARSLALAYTAAC
jgi:hypothetical protein